MFCDGVQPVMTERRVLLRTVVVPDGGPWHGLIFLHQGKPPREVEFSFSSKDFDIGLEKSAQESFTHVSSAYNPGSSAIDARVEKI